eukprot:scaffold32765_cov22-Tisochrysis_lutea.AAC.3
MIAKRCWRALSSALRVRRQPRGGQPVGKANARGLSRGPSGLGAGEDGAPIDDCDLPRCPSRSGGPIRWASALTARIEAPGEGSARRGRATQRCDGRSEISPWTKQPGNRSHSLGCHLSQLRLGLPGRWCAEEIGHRIQTCMVTVGRRAT